MGSSESAGKADCRGKIARLYITNVRRRSRDILVDGDWIRTDQRPRRRAREFKYTYRDDDRWWHWSSIAIGPKYGVVRGEVRQTSFLVNNVFSELQNDITDTLLPISIYRP